MNTRESVLQRGRLLCWFFISNLLVCDVSDTFLKGHLLSIITQALSG